MDYNMQFWEEYRIKYPFHADAPISIKPTAVKDCGEHCSVRLVTGWRRWGFKKEDDRDKFVVQYGARKLT